MASHRCRRELRPKPGPPESKGTPDFGGGAMAGARAGLKTRSPSGSQRGQGAGPPPCFCVPRTRFPEFRLARIREIIDPMDQAKLHNSINRFSKTTKEDLLKRRTIILVFQWNQSCYNSPATRGSAVGLFAVPPAAWRRRPREPSQFPISLVLTCFLDRIERINHPEYEFLAGEISTVLHTIRADSAVNQRAL
jgi:hypothetical protein